MFYTIYKTTNTVNNKSYYGAHKTLDYNDDYLGSGTALKRAIKKYGKDNFKKEILFFSFTERDMYIIEREIVNEDIVNSNMTYNQTLGGYGGWYHIDSSGDNNCMKKPEIALKVGKKVSEYIKNNADQHKQVCILGGKARYGKKDTDETKRKRVNTYLTTIRSKDLIYTLMSPSGETYNYATLSECVKLHDLNRNVLKKWINRGIIHKTKTATRVSDSAKNTYGWVISKLS